MACCIMLWLSLWWRLRGALLQGKVASVRLEAQKMMTQTRLDARWRGDPRDASIWIAPGPRGASNSTISITLAYSHQISDMVSSGHSLEANAAQFTSSSVCHCAICSPSECIVGLFATKGSVIYSALNRSWRQIRKMHYLVNG